jgi:hypothetical protein
MVRMSMARLGSDNHTYHIICMRGCVVRHSKDWPPMSESAQLGSLAARTAGPFYPWKQTSSGYVLRSVQCRLMRREAKGLDCKLAASR